MSDNPFAHLTGTNSNFATRTSSADAALAFQREVMEPNDAAQPVDPLFDVPAARLPYNGKSKVGHSEAGQIQQERDDAEGGTTSHRQAATLDAVSTRGPDGITIAELCAAKGWHHGQASSQLSNLDKVGELVRLKARRKGQSVYVRPEFIDGREVSERRVNPNVVIVGEPEIRHVEVPVPTPIELPQADRDFVAMIVGKVEQNRTRGALPFKVTTMDRLLGIIKTLEGK